MPQMVIIIGAWAIVSSVGFVIYKYKNRNCSEKIEIMSVRSELKKIDKLNKSERDSMF